MHATLSKGLPAEQGPSIDMFHVSIKGMKMAIFTGSRGRYATCFAVRRIMQSGCLIDYPAVRALGWQFGDVLSDSSFNGETDSARVVVLLFTCEG